MNGTDSFGSHWKTEKLRCFTLAPPTTVLRRRQIKEVDELHHGCPQVSQPIQGGELPTPGVPTDIAANLPTKLVDEQWRRLGFSPNQNPLP